MLHVGESDGVADRLGKHNADFKPVDGAQRRMSVHMGPASDVEALHGLAGDRGDEVEILVSVEDS